MAWNKTESATILQRGLKNARAAVPTPKPEDDPIYGCLRAIYSTLRLLKKESQQDVKAAFKNLKIKMHPRSGKDLARKLLEDVLPKDRYSPKMKGRYANTLNWALTSDVNVMAFRNFVRKHGGIHGCSEAMIRHKKRHPRKS